ncbi:MAG: homoserine dehydrogenase, partial [Eubacteriales bacterium]
GNRVVHDFSVILNDPEVSIVCETMGGSKPAFEYSLSCLQAGKSVVTSNKEVVANFGNLLCDAARDHGVRYLYEASVGGGIPIIRSIKSSMAGDKILEINGILNGTTNYILTEMEKSGKTMQDALAEAQKLGYAERDPSADINGADSARKICILAALAFGTLVSPSLVSTEGIRNIRTEDTEIAKKFGASVKLIGSTGVYPDGKIDIRVSPCLVTADNPISTVDGVFNAIMVKASCLGSVMFYGQGAGSLPTASAVLSDIIDIAKHLKTRQPVQESWRVAEEEDVYEDDEVPMNCYAAVAASPEKVLDKIPDARILYSDDTLTAFICDHTKIKSFEDRLAALQSTVLSKFRAL